MESNSGKGKVVCVTGATGFIASWIVKLLLLRGYTVKGTVRDPNDSGKVGHLLKLEGAKERLQLIKANLLEEGSFDQAVETELIDPAVKGTLNVLKSCAKSPYVKRVILTSSLAAVVYNGRPMTPEVVVDETWFSNPDICRENKFWYALSKTLAEDAAWKFSKENSIDMVALNPTVAIGPLLQPSLNESSAAVLNIINGAKTFPNLSFGWINVKDVANAHIQAFEISSASGRYCLVETTLHYSDVVKILLELYPTLQLPEKCDCEDDKAFMPVYQVSKEKARTLGIEFIPLEASLKETLESLKEKNLVNF
ncbi:phenylacetaldehyde reductase-like isoform X3 [Prosopis cineraria]|uniref:phenylacetaldehyde reductase-like isoform X3 n=1 Tax=Prosopis cineraria TaxID=364024 RepID=UPI00241095F9|nr:phenylacetaldehyde reductase-like isoform X3 [Prosopis cineraria]